MSKQTIQNGNTNTRPLPAGWRWARLGDIILDIQSGKSLKTEERPAELYEWGVLKVSAVSWGKFNPDENKAVPSAYTPPPQYEVQSDDLLISRANTTELVGATVLVETTRPQLMLSDKTLRLIPDENLATKSFLQVALRSPGARKYIETNAAGTSDSMKNRVYQGLWYTVCSKTKGANCNATLCKRTR